MIFADKIFIATLITAFTSGSSSFCSAIFSCWMDPIASNFIKDNAVFFRTCVSSSLSFFSSKVSTSSASHDFPINVTASALRLLRRPRVPEKLYFVLLNYHSFVFGPPKLKLRLHELQPRLNLQPSAMLLVLWHRWNLAQGWLSQPEMVCSLGFLLSLIHIWRCRR